MPKAAAAAPAGGPPPTEARLKALYSVMQSIENKLGGGEGVEGLYGSIKKSGMDRVLECMKDKCELDGSSVLVDIGAGLGRPLMHALLEPGVAGARGIEIDRIKCDKAAAFLKQAVAELQRRGMADGGLVPPPVECSAIENVRSLDPCTHAYSFWEGVPIEGKAAFGSLFAASTTMRSVAVVQRAIRTCPLAYMEDLNFGELELVGSFSVSMSGSGRSFTAYVFNKAHLPAVLPARLAVDQAAAQSVQTPAQAAEAAAAVVSVGAVAPAAEMDGETAQSRPLAAAGVAAVGAGGSQRQRRPSAKQLAAQEEQEEEEVEERAARPVRRQQQPRQRQQEQQPAVAAAVAAGEQSLSSRQQRAQRRNAAVWEPAKAAGQQQVQQPPMQAEQPAQQGVVQVLAAPAPSSPLRSPRGRSSSRPAAAAAAASKPAAAAKLSSPQKAGVQKRASPPTKPSAAAGARSPQQAVRTSPRRLVQALATAGKDAEGVQLPKAPGSNGPLQRAVRVIKSSVADGMAKLRPGRQAATAAARRGLRSGDMVP